jgi:hypothetical protein
MRSIPPVWLGIGLAVGYLLSHWVFDSLFLLFWGFPDTMQPAWRNDQWWTDLINAALIGYVPVALRIGRHGIAQDLTALRSNLRCTDAEFTQFRAEINGPGGPLTRALSLSGVPIGIAITYLDPSASGPGSSNASLSDPAFAWALLRIPILAGFLSHLIVADIRATRHYAALSRDWVIVDLLDVRSLAAVARRGQRSVLTWAVFSSIFSLFWLGNSAARSNTPLLALVLSLATAAYFVPLFAIRKNIRAEKKVELDRLREEIRSERQVTRAAVAPGAEQSPRLANLVTYYRLIESSREWPIDATNLVRVAFYLILGLGSWLGGALVERILDGVLGG